MCPKKSNNVNFCNKVGCNKVRLRTVIFLPKFSDSESAFIFGQIFYTGHGFFSRRVRKSTEIVTPEKKKVLV